MILDYRNFTALFKERVSRLASNRQLELAITISEKLFPNYEAFVSHYKWGNAGLLMEAIKMCDHARVSPIDKLKFAEMAEQVDAITPHMNDYGDYIESYALNACQAVYYSLQFLINIDYINIFYIGTSLTDTIDFKVQEDNELTEEQIDNHREMIEVRNYLIGVTANINV
jgi:uncharacterized protein YjaG (DUF416 family)